MTSNTPQADPVEVALKACPTPWCKHEDKPYVWQHATDLYTVICADCRVEGPHCDTEAEAIEAWNARTIPPTAASGELVERPRQGTRVIGLHEDNNTELFDIEDADEAMFEAAGTIEALSAQLATLETRLAHMTEAAGEMAAALREWKCPSCGGAGDYLNRTRERGEELVPCKVCEVTGQHPTARTALQTYEASHAD